METKIYLEPTKIIYVEAENGSAGAKTAFFRLEKNLSLKGRKFYGLVSENGQKYLAATVFRPGDEVLGFPQGEIKGGTYRRLKIVGWQNKLSTIAGEFNQLAQKYSEDQNRSRVEFYRSQKELFLLLPVLDK